MKKIIQRLTAVSITHSTFNWGMLLLRVIVSAELMVVHGLKKIGVGVAVAEAIPNPLGLPELLNNCTAIAANLIFPVFVMTGLFTRLAILPILAVTLTGYFVLHWNSPLLVKDVPLMYSMVYLFILFFGAGRFSLDNLLAGKPVYRQSYKKCSLLK